MNCGRSLKDALKHNMQIIADDPKHVICAQCLDHNDGQSTDHGDDFTSHKSKKVHRKNSLSHKYDPY